MSLLRLQGLPRSQAYEICPICRWEDDPVQLADPWFAGGANHSCLLEAQHNFATYGVCELSKDLLKRYENA